MIGSDILLIEATFMGRQFVSHTQICGVDLRTIKRKSPWLTYLHIYVEWVPQPWLLKEANLFYSLLGADKVDAVSLIFTLIRF